MNHLYSKCGSLRKELLQIAGGTHNDTWTGNGWDFSFHFIFRAKHVLNSKMGVFYPLLAHFLYFFLKICWKFSIFSKITWKKLKFWCILSSYPISSFSISTQFSFSLFHADTITVWCDFYRNARSNEVLSRSRPLETKTNGQKSKKFNFSQTFR